MDFYMTVVKNTTTGLSEEYVYLNEQECEAMYEEQNVPAAGGWVGAFTMPEGQAVTLNQANADYYKD